MSQLFVKPGNTVQHNGVTFEAGEPVTGEVSEREAKQLLNAGVVQTTDPAKGKSELDTHVPTDEEIAAAAAEAGGESEDKKKGIFR